MKNELIVEIGKKQFEGKNQIVHLTGDAKVDLMLNDLTNMPHAFVLGCLMDRQIRAEKAWAIPVKVFDMLKASKVEELSKIPLERYREVFSSSKLHRFPDRMAKVFHAAVMDIHSKYANDASRIWKGTPSSASVVYKFLEFEGSGIKISTMAANILARQLNVPFSDYYSIDISPDVHVKRVMARMGYVPQGADNDKIIYKARELNPEFPGIIDFSCWEIGRMWCHQNPKSADCKNCMVSKDCKKVL